jgi:hypothetical protein
LFGSNFKRIQVMESKKMMKKELSFMKKKGAPKSMIKHEKAEAKGMKKYAEGGVVKKMAMGGMSAPGSMAPGYGGGDSFTQMPVPAGPMKRPMMGGMGGMDSMQEMRGMRGQRYAKGGAVKKCAEGGAVKVPPKPYVPTAGDLNEKAGGDQEMENRSQSRGPGRGPMSRNAMKPKMYAKGGMVKADGCAVKGKTKGRFI